MAFLPKLIVVLFAVFCFVQLAEMSRIRRDEPEQPLQLNKILEDLQKQVESLKNNEQIKSFTEDAQKNLAAFGEQMQNALNAAVNAYKETAAKNGH